MPDTLDPPPATPAPAPTPAAPTTSSGDEPAVAVAGDQSVVAQLVAMRATGAQFIRKFGTSNDINALVRESGAGGIIIPDNSSPLMLVGEGGERFSATGDIIDAEVILAGGQRAIVSRFGGDLIIVPPQMRSVRNKLVDRYVRKYPGDLARWQEEARELERRGQPLPPLLSYLKDSGRLTTPAHGLSGGHEGQAHAADVGAAHGASENLRDGSSSAPVTSGSSSAVSGSGGAVVAAAAATAAGGVSSVTEIEASLTQARVQLQSAQAQLSAYGRPKEMTRTGEDGHYESTDPEYNKLAAQVELSAGNVRSLFNLRNSTVGAGAAGAVVAAAVAGAAGGENTLTGSMAAPFSGEMEFKTTIGDEGGSSSARSGVRLDVAASPAAAQPSARLSAGGDTADSEFAEEAPAEPEEAGGEEKQTETTEEKKESDGSDETGAGKQTAPKSDKPAAQKPQQKPDEAPKTEAKPGAAAAAAPENPVAPETQAGKPPVTGDGSQPDGAVPGAGAPTPAPSPQPSGASGPGSEVGAPLPGNQGGPSQPGGGQTASSGGGSTPTAGASGGGGGAAGAAASALKGGGGAKQKGPPTEEELREQQKKEEDSNFDFILLSLLLPAAILFDLICLIPIVAEILGTLMMPVVRFVFWMLDIRPGRLIENLINRILEQQAKGGPGPSVPLPKETGKVLKVIFDSLFVSLTVIRVIPFASEVSFSTSIFILTTYILCKAEERAIKKFKQALKVVGAVGRVVAKLPIGPEAQVIGGALAAADDVVNKGTPAGEAVAQEMSGAIPGAGGAAGGAAGAGAQAGGAQAAMGMGKELGVGGQAAGAEQGTGPAGSPLMSGTPMYTGKQQAPVDGIRAPAGKRQKSDFDRMAQQGRIISKRGQRARRKADEEAKKFMEENPRLAAGLIKAVEGDDGRFAGGTPGATGSPTFGADSGKPGVAPPPSTKK